VDNSESTPNASPKLKTSSLSFLTNWKFLVIVGVFAIISVGEILLLKGLSPAPAEPTPPVIQQSSPPAPQPQTQDTIPPQVRKSFATQGECEAETGKKCDFIMCDYVPPGKTFEEVCGKDFKKGWQATSEPAQVDTSTWQTYRNDEYGFEVKYPFDTFVVAPVEIAVYPDFEIKYKGEKLIYAGREKMLGKKKCSYGEAGFAVVCNSASEDGISFIIVDKDISYFKNAGSAGREDEREVVLGGRKGIKYSYEAEGFNTEHYYIHVQHKPTPNAIYLPQTLVITVKSNFNWDSSIRSPSKELADQILSTFRFAP